MPKPHTHTAAPPSVFEDDEGGNPRGGKTKEKKQTDANDRGVVGALALGLTLVFFVLRWFAAFTHMCALSRTGFCGGGLLLLIIITPSSQKVPFAFFLSK